MHLSMVIFQTAITIRHTYAMNKLTKIMSGSRRGIPFNFLLMIVFWAVMFILYGFTLTTNAVFICTLILRVLSVNIGFFRNGEYRSSWLFYLLLGGFCSLFTLYKMYNPDKEVLTNIDHHALKFVGYTSRSNTACLIDGRENVELPPVFNVPGLNGFSTLKGEGDSVILKQNLCQPVYRKKGNVRYLLNASSLPAFTENFTLNFNNGTALSVLLKDCPPTDSIKRFHSQVHVNFIDSIVLQNYQGSFSRFIYRSLPLMDLISDIPVPDDFQLDWSLLRGISVIRDNAGAPADSLAGKGYHLSLDSKALSSIANIQTDKGNFSIDQLSQVSKIGIPSGSFISIGSGLTATPFVCPSVTDNNKLMLAYDTQIKHLLPYEKDSLDQRQTVIVTSDLQAMAESSTISALYYPVLAQFSKDQQFRFALEYQPEETRVSLVCKMQLYDNETPGPGLSPRKDGTYLLHAGDRITLTREGRYLSPVFQLQDFRTTVPFNAKEGYLLILFVMLAAGISLTAGLGKVETRGETCLWLGMLVLMTYRAFVAWRTSVFPPLDGISESRFMNVYLDNVYTFYYFPILLTVIILIPSLYYKLFCLRKGKEGLLGIRNLKIIREQKYPFLFLPVLVIIVVTGGYCVGSFILGSERLAYVFSPVIAFLLSEWFYHDKAVSTEEQFDYRWRMGRYTAMLISMAVPMALDTGFGIVFALFLLLYNALDCLFFFKFQTNFRQKDPLSMFNRRVRSIIMISFVVLFVLLMVFGPYVVSLLYHNFMLIAGILLVVVLVFIYMYVSIARKGAYSRSWKYAPVVISLIFYVLFVSVGTTMLQKYRHFLYRSEIHIKEIDDIMMDNDFGSRDLERLFEASQNRWYLGYYLKDRAWDQAVPFSKAYDLRKHFNKGVSWDTQKTDVVLSRYIIGEHSVWAVYVLIVMLVLLFTAIFVSARGRNKYTLLGCGAILLLFCQSLFITMAVTNRFIFFGQDFPLISQHSLLTLLLTLTLFATAILSTLQPVTCEEDTYSYNLPDKKSIGILIALFLILVAMDPSLSGADRTFDVGDTFKQTRAELGDVNRMLANYQSAHRDTLAKQGVIRHFKTDEQIEKEKRSKKIEDKKPRILQSDYSRFIHMFDEEMAVGDTLTNKANRGGTGVSRFTASLYRMYRDKLSKENKSSDIIHLKANQSGILQFSFSKGYYLLTTPESDELVWTGDLLPSEKAAQTSVLKVQSPKGAQTVPFRKDAGRLDNHKALSYDFPIYLAKPNDSWIVGGKPVFITRARSIPLTIKHGASAYRISKEGANAHYMVLQNDDCIETERNEHVGNQGGKIYVKGDIGRYFARNMLVNGKRELVYPLGEKFFYPYHVSQIAKALYSGTDTEKRKTNVRLTLSYSMTENIYNIMDKFTGSVYEPYARGVIVADGQGHIKSLVTVKNPNYNSGYYRVNPNDENEISRLTQQYYLFGDNMAEEHTFGDINLNYMQPGPGSSIKPITFTSVASMVHYDWRKLQLYYNASEQDIKHKGKEVWVNRYANINKHFPSLYNDEKGYDNKGLTDIRQYMKRSSNYFNSLMVFMGFYQPEFLRTELAKIRQGKKSSLFMPYKANSETSFPAFTLHSGDDTRKFNFRQYVIYDKQGIHQNGALATGFNKNYGLYRDFPQNLPSYVTNKSRNLLELTDTIPVSFYTDFAYAFNRVSFLPDDERTTFQGAKDAITNTTLGASPFAITPVKMAEMFGRLVTHNRAFRLTLNPNTVQCGYEPFELDPMYENSGTLYQDILSNHLFNGMSQVVITGGTANNLNDISSYLLNQGYYLYGKTGTISHQGGKQSQLLGLIISKEKLHNIKNLDELRNHMKENRFYVIYFSNADGLHNYALIKETVKSITSSSEFRAYMEGEEESN